MSGSISVWGLGGSPLEIRSNGPRSKSPRLVSEHVRTSKPTCSVGATRGGRRGRGTGFSQEVQAPLHHVTMMPLTWYGFDTMLPIIPYLDGNCHSLGVLNNELLRELGMYTIVTVLCTQ